MLISKLLQYESRPLNRDQPRVYRCTNYPQQFGRRHFRVFCCLAALVLAQRGISLSHAESPHVSAKASQLLQTKIEDSASHSGPDELLRKRKASLLNEEGVSLVFKGAREQGVAKIKEALAYDPGNSAILYNLAGIYLTQGDLEPAKLVIEKAIEIEPNDVPFLSRYGEILITSKNFEKAVGVFKRILEIEPQHSDAMLKLGATYGMLEKWDLAEETLRRAHSLRGDDIGLLSNLGNILVVREKYEEAILLLERAQQIRANADNAVTLGIACEALGKKKRALIHYKEAKALGKEDGNLESHIHDLSNTDSIETNSDQSESKHK